MIPPIARFAPLAAIALLAACGPERPAAGGGALVDTTRQQAAAAPVDTVHGDTTSPVMIAEFAQAGGGPVVTVAPPPPDTLRASDLSQQAEVLASVGPYAFVASRLYANSCGAHGNTTMRFQVLDLDTGQPVELIDSAGRARLAASDRGQVAAAFKADSAASGVEHPDSAVLTLLAPAFAGDRLTLSYQFTADACYACGDDRWSAYSRSVRLPAAELPAALEPYARTPLEVQAAFRQLRPDSGGGWSLIALPPATRGALAHLFGVTAPVGGQEYLVWHRAPDGELESAWLRGSAMEATVVGRARGVWIVAGGRAWTWRTRTVPVHVTPCGAPTARP